MDDEVAASLYIRHPIADEDLKLYADPSDAAIDGGHGGGHGGGRLEWLEGFCRDLFEVVSDNVSRLNQLVEEGNTSVRPLPNQRGSQPSQRAQRSSTLTRKTAAGPSRDRRPLPATSPTSPPASRSPTATKTTPKVARQKLPNLLQTMDALLEAWTTGVNGLLPMRTFVGNKNDMKLDRRERKHLSGHRFVVCKCLGEGGQGSIGRDQFRREYELDATSVKRSLRSIREMIEKEGGRK